MKKILLLITIIFFSASAKYGADSRILSPDKRISIEFKLIDTKPAYCIKYNNKTLVDFSTLGFQFKNQKPLINDFLLISCTHSSKNERWKPLWGISEYADNNYNEMSITLKEKTSAEREMIIIFRAYNDGAAFRYILPEQKNISKIEITSEETYFNFAGNYTAWWQPMDFDTYEFLFTKTKLDKMPNVNPPVTMKADDKTYLSIYQAELVDYSDMKLVRNNDKKYSYKTGLVPWPDSIMVKGSAPLKTPWRVIQIANSAGSLIVSHLIENLNEPCKINDVSWIKPLKYVGVWWGMQIGKYTWEAGPKHGATTENAKRYIDFAAKHKFNAVLYEGWNKGWETWKDGVLNVQSFTEAYPDFNLVEVVNYAKNKNIEIMTHNETGGNIPDYERQIDSAFALYNRLGIHALKTGYAGGMTPSNQFHHGQWMVNHYNSVVQKCAANKIILDAHEPVNQSGLSRTFPNWFAQEGARGQEWNAGEQRNPPGHTTILPFTRLLIGPLDYTPGIFNLNYDTVGHRRVPSTLANQLALFVVLYSPWQMASDMIENYENHPAFKFFEDTPVTFDESVPLKSEIGEYLSVARRKGDEWFVAGITNEKERELKIPFTFLDKTKKYIARFYVDAVCTDWKNNPAEIEIDSCIITSKDVYNAVLSKAGGFAISIRPIIESNTKYTAVAKLNSSASKKLAAYKKIELYGKPLTVSNIAKGAKLNFLQPYSMKYSGGSINALIDGIIGNTDFNVAWTGFEKNDMETVIDLGKPKNINSIAVNFLQAFGSWIFVPSEIEYLISADGKEYTGIASFKYTTMQQDEPKTIRTFTQESINKKIRFVKIKAKNIGNCPEWHYAKGGAAWIFADEIIIK